jgi:uncharacterized protein YgbK (DUF1537 family)
VKLLILADDLTGAIDTSVQISELGISTRIITNTEVDLAAVVTSCSVLTIDTETRHKTPQQAEQLIFQLVQKAVSAGFSIIYKKTDSALRGNIGAELAALAKSYSRTVHFAPAFPRLGRLTQQGAQYINGLPVSQSVFGKDPFDPIHHSWLPDVIAQQSGIPVHIVNESDPIPPSSERPEILVYDSTTDSRLGEISRYLIDYMSNKPLLLAGCAGFASHLGYYLEKDSPVISRILPCEFGILVISGSLNPITREQIAVARKNGFAYISLHGKLLDTNRDQQAAIMKEIENVYRSNNRIILEVGSETHSINCVNVEEGLALAQSVGALIGHLFEEGFHSTILVTGGDTLMGVMNSMGVQDIKPICEIEPGVVYTITSLAGQSVGIIAKSGGIGSRDIFLKVQEFLLRRHT